MITLEFSPVELLVLKRPRQSKLVHSIPSTAADIDIRYTSPPSSVLFELELEEEKVVESE